MKCPLSQRLNHDKKTFCAPMIDSIFAAFHPKYNMKIIANIIL